MTKKRDQPSVREWLKCPACDRKNFLYSRKAHCFFCRVCGAIFDADYVKREPRLISKEGS